MARVLGVGQQIVGGQDGLDDLAIAAAAGYDAVALHTTRLDGVDPAALAARGLTAAGYLAVRGILDDPPGVEAAIRAAGRFGAGHVVVTTGPIGDRSVAEADRCCAGWFARWQPVAAEAGVVLAVEPMHPHLAVTTYVHTVGHAVALCGAVVVDTGHVYGDPGLLDHPAAVVAVQVADVDGPLVAGGGYDRVPLGDGPVPNHELVPALLAAGVGADVPIVVETLLGGRPPTDELRRSREVVGSWLA